MMSPGGTDHAGSFHNIRGGPVDQSSTPGCGPRGGADGEGRGGPPHPREAAGARRGRL